MFIWVHIVEKKTKKETLEEYHNPPFFIQLVFVERLLYIKHWDTGSSGGKA